MAKVRRMKDFHSLPVLSSTRSALMCDPAQAIFQWIAVAAVGIWLAVMIVQAVGTLPSG